MTELHALEGAFFMALFITGFTGLLVAGILVHDFFDRRRRYFEKILQNVRRKTKQ